MCWPKQPAASATYPPTKAMTPKGRETICARAPLCRSFLVPARTGTRSGSTRSATANADGWRQPSADSKDYRRIATRYEKLARHFASALALAAVAAFGCGLRRDPHCKPVLPRGSRPQDAVFCVIRITSCCAKCLLYRSVWLVPNGKGFMHVIENRGTRRTARGRFATNIPAPNLDRMVQWTRPLKTSIAPSWRWTES